MLKELRYRSLGWNFRSLAVRYCRSLRRFRNQLSLCNYKQKTCWLGESGFEPSVGHFSGIEHFSRKSVFLGKTLQYFG